jgi:hypothetical protein
MDRRSNRVLLALIGDDLHDRRGRGPALGGV